MNDYVERVKDEDRRPRDLGHPIIPPPAAAFYAATPKSETLGPLALLVMGLPPGTTLSFEVSLPGRKDG